MQHYEGKFSLGLSYRTVFSSIRYYTVVQHIVYIYTVSQKMCKV